MGLFCFFLTKKPQHENICSVWASIKRRPQKKGGEGRGWGMGDVSVGAVMETYVCFLWTYVCCDGYGVCASRCAAYTPHASSPFCLYHATTSVETATITSKPTCIYVLCTEHTISSHTRIYVYVTNDMYVQQQLPATYMLSLPCMYIETIT